MDATCLVMSGESPSRVVRGRRVSDPEGGRMTKTCQRLRKTCTDRQRSIVAVITTVSAAPAERNMPGSVRSRLKHIRQEERRCSRIASEPGSRRRLPLAAG